MITTSLVDKLAYCASNIAYDFNSEGVFLPNKEPGKYQNDPYLKFLHQNGASRIVPFSNSDGWSWDLINAAIIIEFPKISILAFRGTIPPIPPSCIAFQDWMSDLLVGTKRVNGFEGRVHTGIYDAYHSLKDEIFSHLESGKPLIITGHSKGGPMSTYAAYDAINHYGLEVHKVITFASPRPGDREFANEYNAILASKGLFQTRYENDLDVVPLLPPEQDNDREYAELLSVMAFGLYRLGYHKMAEAVEIFAGLLEGIYEMDYYPVGKLQYITKDHQIVPESPSLWSVRAAQFGILFEDHPLTALSYIFGAHSIAIGGGYQKGVFPDLKK